MWHPTSHFGTNSATATRMIGLCTFLLFFLTGDAILSYLLPELVQSTFDNAFIMGLIIGFSSVVGLAVDFFLPQLLRSISVQKMLWMTAISGVIFSLLVLQSTWWPYVVIFLAAVSIWGVYYEFLAFARQQFVSTSIPNSMHASAWGMIDFVRSVAYVAGPLLVNYVFHASDRLAITLALVCSIAGFLILLIVKMERKHTVDPEEKEEEYVPLDFLSLWTEMKHWKTLLVSVWPVVLLSTAFFIIDATFWTTGTVWAHSLLEHSSWGGLLLTAYTLPFLFSGLLLVRWGITQWKKWWAAVFLGLAGLALFSFSFLDESPILLGMVFLAGLAVAFVQPLTEAIYSDILGRMGAEKRHLIGLSSATGSLGYSAGPMIVGAIASQYGEGMTFTILGASMIVLSAILLLTMPRKVRLPQSEIQTWSE